MGEVYLARAIGPAGFEKTCALKLLNPQLSDDPARVRELLREALIGVELNHPNVVEVLDLGCEDGRHFVAMEYVRGYSLSRVLDYARSDERMPIESAVHVACAIADALEYLHEATGPGGSRLGLMHGDVSATNILLGVDGQIKLSDFGVASFAEDAAANKAVAGKLQYLPREAFRGAARDPSWDVYALGVVLYEAVTGKLPYPGRTVAQVLNVMDRPVPPPRELRAGCHPMLSDMILHAITHEPEARFQTARDFRDALNAAHPRLIEDAEKHRSFLRRVFGASEWVKRHGELPTTSRITPVEALEGYLQVEEDETVDVRPPKPIRMGLSPARGAKAARQHGRRLASLLEQRLNRQVRTAAFADYAGLVDALSTGAVDIAWMPPLLFVEAMERGAEAIVVAKRSGSTSYRSVVFVRADSELQTLEDLRGNSVAWVDPESSSGYLAAAATIARELGPLSQVFSEQSFVGSHRAVCEAVVKGWATAGATYASLDPEGNWAAAGWDDFLPGRAGEIRAIASSDPIPGDNIAHRSGLPPRIVEQLVEVFTELGDDVEGKEILRDVFSADALVPTSRTEYLGMRALLDVVREAKKKTAG